MVSRCEARTSAIAPQTYSRPVENFRGSHHEKPIFAGVALCRSATFGYAAATDFNETSTSTSVVTATTTGGVPQAGNGLTTTTTSSAFGSAGAEHGRLATPGFPQHIHNHESVNLRGSAVACCARIHRRSDFVDGPHGRARLSQLDAVCCIKSSSIFQNSIVLGILLTV